MKPPCFLSRFWLPALVALGGILALPDSIRGQTPAAVWSFDEGTGTTAGDSSGNSHPATLSGATWTSGAKLGAYALSLTKASSHYASATGAVVNTNASFTVIAWVKFTTLANNETVMSIDGTTVSGFYLQYQQGLNKIVFNRLASDSNSTSTLATAIATTSTGVWYHLAGVYNSSAQTIALYINGTLQQSVAFSSPWQATGNTAIGRGRWSGANADYVDGVIDDARIYASALTLAQIQTIYNNTGAALSGTVFEDVNYSGGGGRSLAASGGAARAGARVELYTAAGAYSTATTTDASGNYSFGGLTSNTNYTIRVVNSTVTSSFGGSGLIPVPTYRTTATGAVTAVTDRVGGEDPGKADAGNGSTTLAALTAGSLLPQSITACTTDTGTKTDIDFGFNFNTIVNTNDAGQGSLRQMIANSNGMAGTQTSVFMITDGAAHAGLRAGLASDLTGGVAVITLASALPQITDTLTLDGTSQTSNIGNTNAGSLGAGGSVGVDALSLSLVNRPEVEIVGISALAAGLDLAAAGTTIKGLAIHGFGSVLGEGDIVIAASGVTITECIVGATATSFSLPSGSATGGTGIAITSGSTGSIANNLIGFTGHAGVRMASDTSSAWTISNNEVRGVARADSARNGIGLRGSGHTVAGNLAIACKGFGFAAISTGSSACTFVNNTVTGCGTGTAGTRQTAGVSIKGTNHTVDRNKISANYGSGILLASTATGGRFTKNSLYANGTILNDAGGAATGAIGIDLQVAADDADVGTAPYFTINDSGDGDTGGNNLLNYPILATAAISGSNLTLTGWVRAGSVIEVFISDGDPSGFGEGQTYLTSLTEGSGSDTDATSSSYSGSINGIAQGADTTSRFAFTIAVPGGVSGGTKLTATATNASNNTSEFSGQVTVTSNGTLSGTVFEDVGYLGGAGRSLSASSGVPRSGTRVELYTAAGAYSTATTTDASGNYSFGGLTSNTNYTIRVVNGTVTSSLGGSGLIPVPTYRTTATGTVTAVTDRVGGEDPGKADAGNGSTTLAALTAGSLLPQSIAACTTNTGTKTDIDFGFNFNTIVNTNDAGQGSLRQMIANSNGMAGTQTSVFMITDGAAHAGLRAGLASDLTGGVAVITLASQLPTPSDAIIYDGTTQTTNIGNTNSGTLGTGGTVGVDGVALGTVNRPEVELVGTSAIGSGILMGMDNSTLKGFAIHGFGVSSGQGDVVVGGSGLTITQNVIGTTATSFTLPASNRSGATALRINPGTGCIFTQNLIGFTGYYGVFIWAGISTWTISQNEIRGCGRTDAVAGLQLSGTGHSVSQNLIVANKGCGIDMGANMGDSSSQSLVNNTITGNGVGTVGTRRTSGVRFYGTSHAADRNIVSLNYGGGFVVTSASTGNRFTRNSTFGNGTIVNDGAEAATGQIGIDLQSATDDAALGTAPYRTLNDDGDADTGGNNRLNFPVIDTAIVLGSNLEIAGWAPTGATLEFFLSDTDASGFGEGQTYVGSVVEGGGSDTDATTSSYSGNVNGIAQGSGTNVRRFKYTLARPGGITPGTTKLTATATDASNNTSEFSGQATIAAIFPSFTAVMAAQVYSDPVNTTTNPKAIPGSFLYYSTVTTNSNTAPSDADSFSVTDAIPANTQLYVGDLGGAGSGPVSFTNGATSSTLTYSFVSLASATDDVQFSSDSGTTWTYTPTPDSNGCDASVTHLRASPKGTFAPASGSNHPSCTIAFRLRVK